MFEALARTTGEPATHLGRFADASSAVENRVRVEGDISLFDPAAPSRRSASPAQSEGAGGVRLSGLYKTFQVDGRPLPVLQDISLDFQPGAFTALVGPSGCGKSTILRLIAGLDTPDSGEVCLDGRPISGPGLERGLVFQEHRLLPWLTVQQNVALSLEATDLTKADKARLVQEYIALVGLAGFERAYPRQLSGGMAQRGAIARALASRPEVLLLDEPLGALDSLTRAKLQQELLRIWRQQQVTMIMVTHDIEEAVFLADRIVVMASRPGRVAAIIPVNLPHPRNRLDPRFAQARQAVLDALAV
jgi:sulfonate transport system ATP-binding protein